jgi:signal transduction histidine kinase
VIARSVIENSPVFRLPDSTLSVIDRQVSSLVGADNFCCEPCLNPDSGVVEGILVIGVPLDQAEKYKKQKHLRNLLACELGGYLEASPQPGQTAEQDVAAEYDRRIREAIQEANNPLGIIKNYLQLLSMKQEGDTKVQSEISFIKSEIDRVSKILETLKKAHEVEQARALDVNAVISSLVSMFRGSLAADDHITIETDLDPAVPELVCHEDALRQIITNLVKNAAEALVDGGTINIMTTGDIYMDGHRFVQLVVRDDGPGIDPAVLDRLFTPGNTTKDGNHTGSGLSIVNNLVKNLGDRSPVGQKCKIMVKIVTP